MLRDLIEDYAVGGKTVLAALQGLSQEQLNAEPVPGTWTLQQNFIHLYDSDQIGISRMKLIIAEDRPQIAAYDQDAFVRNLFYAQTDAHAACRIFDESRLLFATVLRQLPDEAFERTGIHSEDGEVTLRKCVEKYIEHVKHHMKFIHQKRELVGNPV